MRRILLDFWHQRSAQEQRTLRLGGAVALLLLGYALLWYPLSQERSRLQAEVPKLRQAKQLMTEQAAEIARLKAQPQPAAGSDMRAAMANASLRSNFPAPRDVQALDPGHLRIRYESASFEGWLEWTRILQSEGRIRIESADIRAQPEPGKVTIQAVLASTGTR